jgi:hypothetical protein
MSLPDFLLKNYISTSINIQKVQGIRNPVIPTQEGTIEGVVQDPLAPLIARLWSTIVILGGLMVIIFLLWGALEWITSGGDSNKLQNARAKMTNAAIGLGILAASFAIIAFLGSVFGFNLLEITWPTPPAS